MGGKGSGRPTKEQSIIRGMTIAPQARISNVGGELILPNVSAMKEESLKTFLGVKEQIEHVSTNTTLNNSHHTVLVTGTVTITLPPASTSLGLIYNIKKIDSDATSTTVAAFGSDLVDGFSTQTINSQYDCITVHSDGSDWWII